MAFESERVWHFAGLSHFTNGLPATLRLHPEAARMGLRTCDGTRWGEPGPADCFGEAPSSGVRFLDRRAALALHLIGGTVSRRSSSRGGCLFDEPSGSFPDHLLGCS